MSKTQKKRQRVDTRSWDYFEEVLVLKYMQEKKEQGNEVERPTASVYYTKLLDRVKLSANVNQVKNKVKNLKCTYSLALDWVNQTGQGVDSGYKRKLCPHYDALHAIYGDKTTFSLPYLRDTLEPASEAKSNETDNQDGCNNQNGGLNQSNLQNIDSDEEANLEANHIVNDVDNSQNTLVNSHENRQNVVSSNSRNVVGNISRYIGGSSSQNSVGVNKQNPADNNNQNTVTNSSRNVVGCISRDIGGISSQSSVGNNRQNPVGINKLSTVSNNSRNVAGHNSRFTDINNQNLVGISNQNVVSNSSRNVVGNNSRETGINTRNTALRTNGKDDISFNRYVLFGDEDYDENVDEEDSTQPAKIARFKKGLSLAPKTSKGFEPKNKPPASNAASVMSMVLSQKCDALAEKNKIELKRAEEDKLHKEQQLKLNLEIIKEKNRIKEKRVEEEAIAKKAERELEVEKFKHQKELEKNAMEIQKADIEVKKSKIESKEKVAILELQKQERLEMFKMKLEYEKMKNGGP